MPARHKGAGTVARQGGGDLPARNVRLVEEVEPGGEVRTVAVPQTKTEATHLPPS